MVTNTLELAQIIGAFMQPRMLGFALVLAWTLLWTGLALWHAARRKQTGWFIALLILNTLGILEIIYLAVYVWRTNGSQSEQQQTHPPGTA